MALKRSLRTFKVFIAAAGLTLAISPCLQAGGYKCNCQPSLEVYHSPFFGYYRTCWRPWPGGQPECPRYVVAETEKPRARVGGPERTIELLPPPRPEEPEPK
jgi:hypothetical protein